jgi:hypothetical protein
LLRTDANDPDAGSDDGLIHASNENPDVRFSDDEDGTWTESFTPSKPTAVSDALAASVVCPSVGSF